MIRTLLTKSFYPWLIFFIAACFILFQFVLQFTTGVYTGALINDFHLTAFEASFLVGAYYYIYVTMQTPGGYFVDRFGARNMMMLGAIITTLGCAMFAFTHDFWLAVIGRLLMGLGMSSAFVAGLFLCRNWFNARVFPVLVGAIESIALLGAMFANSFLAHFLKIFTWRDFVFSCALIALIFVLINGLLVRNTPRINEQPRAITAIRPSKHFLADVFALLKNYRVWFNGIYCGIMVAPQTVFVSLWGIPFLITAQHLSLAHATFSSGLIFLGTAVSAPFCGALYPYFKRPRYVMSLFAIAAALLFCLIIFDLKLNYIEICVACFLVGIFANVYLWNFTLVHDMAPSVATSTRIGFTNALCVGMAPVMQLLIGLIMSYLGRHIVFGQHVYGVEAYQIAMTMLPVFCLLGAIMILFCHYRIRDAV